MLLLVMGSCLWPFKIILIVITTLTLTSSQFCVFDILLQSHPQNHRGKLESGSSVQHKQY